MGSPILSDPGATAKAARVGQAWGPEIQELKGGELNLTLPPNGLAVIEIR